jgi:hypothetical protein
MWLKQETIRVIHEILDRREPVRENFQEREAWAEALARD